MEQLIDIHSHNCHSLATKHAIVNVSLQDDLSVPDGYFSAGIHPWHIHIDGLSDQKQLLSTLTSLNNCLAIGECGLDKYAEAPMELQLEIFAFHIELSEALHKPLIIHCVKAVDELLMIKKNKTPLQPWIWHGFRGNSYQAQQLINQGLYLSFGERYHPESLILTPPERLFLETDESNMNINDLLLKASNIREQSAGDLREIIQRNVREVFFRLNSCNFK